MHIKFKVRIAQICAAAALATTVYGQAQPAGRDREAQKTSSDLQSLDASRQTYEETLDTIRRDIEVEFDKSPDPDGLAGYKRGGVLPASKAFDALERKAENAAESLLDAYKTASRNAKRAGVREELSQEANRIRESNDLLPWSSVQNPQRLVAGGDAMRLDIGATGAFRIEVRAKHVGNAPAILLVGVPPRDRRVTWLRSEPNAEGDFCVLASVQNGQVNAELGVNRPIDRSPANSNDVDSTGLWLRAEGADIEVKSVRAKPIVIAHEQAEATKDKKNEKANRADLMPVGSVWSGTSDHSHKPREIIHVRATVIESGDSQVVLDATWMGDSQLKWFLNRQGTRVELVRVEGENDASRSEHGGGGNVSATQLALNWRWRWNDGKQDLRFSGVMRLKRDE